MNLVIFRQSFFILCFLRLILLLSFFLLESAQKLELIPSFTREPMLKGMFANCALMKNLKDKFRKSNTIVLRWGDVRI